MDWRRVGTGFVLAAAVLALFVWAVGIEPVVRALGSTDPGTYAPAPVASLTALVTSATVLYWLTEHVPGAPRGRRFLGGFAVGTFLRALAPWGRSGGSLLTAVALHRRGQARFEELLGATVASEFLASVGSASIGSVGVALLFVSGRGGSVESASVIVAALVLALVVAATVVLVLPDVVVRGSELLLGFLRHTVGRLWGTADDLLVRARVVERVGNFLDTVGGLARDPGTLLPALVLSQVGAILTVVPMWASLRAVGSPVAFPVLMVLVPLTGFASVVPLPGGVGGVEFALVGLLVAVTPVASGDAAAAVLLYRLATYWLGLAVGALGVVAFGGPLDVRAYPS